MITEDYVSYEVAKLLKEKGFDEVCDHYIDCHWEEDGVLLHTPCKTSDLMFGYMCPTHQMAMKWLREMHNIFIIIEPHMYDYMNERNASYVCSIWVEDNYYENPILTDFPSYEEAVEAALKYSLENLI